MGGLTLLDLDGDRLTSLVEFEANFGAIKGNTPPLEAPSTKLLSQSMQAKYSFCVVAVAGIDDLLSLFVGEASLTADHRSGDTSRAKIRTLVQLEYTAVGVLIFIGAERTEEVAQSLRKHRDGSVDEIDAGSTLVGLVIDDTAGLYIVTHVGDMYTHLVESIRKLAEGQCIVEVLSVLRVDRTSQYTSEVLTMLELLFCDGFGESLCCTLYFFGIAVG